MSLQCDEACDGSDWQHTAHAPQWTLLTAFGCAVLVSGVLFFAAVYRGRALRALGALAFGALMLASGLSFWGSDWRAESPRHPLAYGAGAVVLIGGVLAALLSPTDRTG